MTNDLDSLAQQVKRDLERIAYATRSWSPPMVRDDRRVLDVAIIGAGQGGLATAFALRRLGISNVHVFERARHGGAGPWMTFARMITLRTPKHVTGPDLGIPSLTPQSWYEARYGSAAWEALDKIPKSDWQAYLDWYRDTLDVPVAHEHALEDIAWEDGLAVLEFALASGGRRRVFARKVVLATGIDGGGKWYVPPFIADHLPKSRYAHTHEAIDFAALKGKRIGVLGGGASAFDNAATALEAGAGAVSLCVRRETLPRINPYRWMENAGFLAHYAALPDLTRWRFMRHIFSLNQPPPQDTFWRCSRHEVFRFHGGAPWQAAAMDGDEIVITTPKGEMRFDYLIMGTGFEIDLSLRPETAGFAGGVALWRHRFTAPSGEESPMLGSYPYLGRHSQFLPHNTMTPEAPLLSSIYNFTFSATISMGLSGASISGMRFGVERLARGIANDLFVQDGEAHLESLLAYDTEELTSLTAPPGEGKIFS